MSTDNEGILTAEHALGLLPDGRIIEATSLQTDCSGECTLMDARIYDSGSEWRGHRVAIDDRTASGDGLDLPFAEPPRAGIAGIAARWVDGSPSAGVSSVFPLNSARAFGVGVQGGPDTFSMTLAAFDHEGVSTRADLGRVDGDPAFLVSGAERIGLGALVLSLDGSLGNPEGRRHSAGSQRHFGAGREELTVGLTTGTSTGHLALRYVASRGQLEHSDTVHLDGVVVQTLAPFDTRSELGITAASSRMGFEPAAGAAIVIEAPLGSARWRLTPRVDLRALSEEQADSPVDVAGAAFGAGVRLIPLSTSAFRVSLRLDGELGAELRTGVSPLTRWNAPTNGWRAGGTLEVQAGGNRSPRFAWTIQDQEDIPGPVIHVATIRSAGKITSLSASAVVADAEWRGTEALATISTRLLRAYVLAIARDDAFVRPRAIGSSPLRRNEERGPLESTTAFGFESRVGQVTVDAETAYVVRRRGAERGFGGRGLVAYAPTGRTWALVAEVGHFAGAERSHGSLSVRMGPNPGLSAWHRR